eukprot:gene8838-9017_t
MTMMRCFSSSPAAASCQQVYDVAIVGAGMVGAAVAALLRSNPLTAGLHLAIIDHQAPSMVLDMPHYPDLRVSTITPANMQLLQQAGAWEELQQAAPTFQHMQVWEHAGPGFLSWNAAEVALPSMGCVVENRLLQAALLRAAERSGCHDDHDHHSSSSSTRSTGRKTGSLDFLCPGTIMAASFPGVSNAAESSVWSSTEGDSTTSRAAGGGSTPADHTQSSSLATLQMTDGTTLRCRLVVAADGARSKIRQLAGFRTVGWSYEQRGLVATVATDVPNDTAWQRFMPTGPLALLPVRDGFSNVVWTTTPAMAKQLESYSGSQFADAVNEVLQADPATLQDGTTSSTSAVGPLSAAAAAATSILQAVGGGPGAALLKQLTGSGSWSDAAVDGGSGSYWRRPPVVDGWVGSSPKSFPLQLQHSGRYVAPRLALVGDAAHAIHPMAGQGVNLGLGDAAALAAAVASARELGEDIGEVTQLQMRYEAPRQRANLGMMTALEVLWRGFGVQLGAAGAVRAAGMGLLNNVPPLKNSIMKYAMGLA